MITDISWTQYLTVVLSILLLYYMYIGFRYYFTEIKSLMNGYKKTLTIASGSDIASKESAALNNIAEPVDEGNEPVDDPNVLEVTAIEVGHLMVRLKEIVEKASLENVNETEFKEDLRSVLTGYPELKATAHQDSVNEMLISVCEKYGAIKLREDEVVMLWDDV